MNSLFVKYTSIYFLLSVFSQDVITTSGGVTVFPATADGTSRCMMETSMTFATDGEHNICFQSA